jgi:hypothetical protein
MLRVAIVTRQESGKVFGRMGEIQRRNREQADYEEHNDGVASGFSSVSCW